MKLYVAPGEPLTAEDLDRVHGGWFAQKAPDATATERPLWSWPRFGEGCAEVGSIGSLVGAEIGARKVKKRYAVIAGAVGCVLGGTVMAVTGG